LYCGTDASLSRIVGRFDSFVREKREEVRPMFQKTFGKGMDLMIGAVEIDLETSVHPRLDGDRFLDKGLPVHIPGPAGVPQSKHAADLLEHPFGELHCIRASAGVFDSFEISKDMGPTDLSEAFMIGVVRTKPVGTKDT
jgi:hypothetical protein